MSTPVEAPSESAATIDATVSAVCAQLEKMVAGAECDLICEFARHFVARTSRGLLQERDAEQLAALTIGAFRFLDGAEPGVPNVQLVDPADEGWSDDVTLLRAAIVDRPFIVDSLREYLAGEHLTIRHFVHPVLGVRRNPRGRVVEVTAPGEGKNDEALVHCELSAIRDPHWREAIRGEVERRLADVVAATDDFEAMLAELDATAAQLEERGSVLPDRRDELSEVAALLRWLKDGNFVFIGFRAYDIDDGGDPVLRVEPGTGLGILRDEARSTFAPGVPLAELPEPLQRRVAGGPLLIVSKTNAEATVHRRARMDYLGVKKLDDQGRVTGERRFLGLFTSKAHSEHAESIPILRRKLDRILAQSGAHPGSHDFKEIITIFNSMPKEELFQASPAELLHEVQTVLRLLFADDVHVSLRPDPLDRGVSVMVVLPRGKFSGEVRQRIQAALARRLNGTVLNYYLAMSAGDQARLHFYLSVPSEMLGKVEPREIEHEIVQIIRSWDDRLLDALTEAFPAAEAHRLAGRYLHALSPEYRAATLPEVAVLDIGQIEGMRRDGRTVALDLRPPRGAGRPAHFQGVRILKLFLAEERLVLSDFMPILENLGLRVIEVTPFAIQAPGLPVFMLYSFAVQGPDGSELPLELSDTLTEAILAVRDGIASNDALNLLVVCAGLRWREVDVLRTYANYVFQIGAVPTRMSITRALTRNPDVARIAYELFRARFDPNGRVSESASTRDSAVVALRGALTGALQAVTTLADDRALRRLVSVFDATVRTNYFRNGGAEPVRSSGGAPYISIKIRCADAEELRRSRLVYEVFVFSSRMEGVHLRGAAVSRGGIRWSDRPDDFRTEVLGLVQTQIVKNAVIVPGGSKGGFITKLHHLEREEMMQESADQYRTLIRGLLDITDNIADGRVVPPEGVIRYDGDDPYLVVAADKGTAHLSDVANEVAAEYGFWLGDAFASGGSFGYDHKKQGITARGAWECVKRHFREMGKDIQEQPFTVVGIGDMSGDVFGNGMLLSRHSRLVAAFDHRHVFIDPDPDPETSYLERERLFRLPRSSWDDYDRSLLSAGAMIVPRTLKEVDLTPEARRALGVPGGESALDGESLVRAVLRAPAELLWNGGIGTYVKDSEETHGEVGDPSSDAVRVDADELRCKVIGEGGNLGLTQKARIRFALGGGRLNTDALDNSAGVDMSDHEVNLKILLNPLVAEARWPFEERNRLLEEMTDEVSSLVLRNNISQSLAVSLDEVRSRESLADFAALITAFERDRLLERVAEGIPSSDTLQERAEEGLGLTRPTLCVLLAYAKLHAQSHLLSSTLPDDPALERYLEEYFPGPAVQAAGTKRLRGHRLRREIVTTAIVNDLVDLMGSSFLHHAARDAGTDIAAVVRAWVIASELAGAVPLRRDLASLEGSATAPTLYRWYFGLARVLARSTRWVLANVAPDASTAAAVEQHAAGLARLRDRFPAIVAGPDRDLFESLLDEIRPLGLDSKLAQRIITLRFLPQLLDIARTAQEAGADAGLTARAYYLVSERFACASIRHAVLALTPRDRWEKRFQQTLVEDVDRAHRILARGLLARAADEDALGPATDDFEQGHGTLVAGYRDLLHELEATGDPPITALATAVRLLLEIAEAA
jgi:glutamate dehydrogenase